MWLLEFSSYCLDFEFRSRILLLPVVVQFCIEIAKNGQRHSKGMPDPKGSNYNLAKILNDERRKKVFTLTFTALALHAG